MTISDIRRASALRLLGIYTAIFIFMAAVYMVLDHFIRIENSAMGLIIAACSAMTMARSWVLQEKAAPAGMRAWTVSLACALVTTALLAGVVVLGVAADDPLLRGARREGPALLAALAAILLLVNLLVIRLGLWIGARQALKLVR